MGAFDDFRNPFDPHRPITKRSELLGRESHLRWFSGILEGLRDREPRHGIAVGRSGFGKTSLLNIFELEAATSRALPVRVRVNDSIASSAESFYEALLAASMVAIERTQALKPSDSRITRWHQQTGRLETAVTPLLLSPTQPFVDPTTVLRDLDVVAGIAHDADRKGLVFLIDNGDSLQDETILQTLLPLLDAAETFSVVVAASGDWIDELTTNHTGLARRFEWLALYPVTSYFDLSDIVVRRVQEEIRERVDFDFGAYIDLLLATRGHPRLLQMVAHRMWASARSTNFAEYKLTSEILSDVLAERLAVLPEDEAPLPFSRQRP